MNTTTRATRSIVAIAAAIGLTVAGCDDAADTSAVNQAAPATMTAPAPGAEARTAGERIGDVGEMFPDSIYEVLAEATEAAVAEGGFDDLVERFAANDRGRFAGIADADFQPLNDAARPVRNAYEAKYGEAFDINDPKAVFRPLVNIKPSGETDDKMIARVLMQPKVQGQNLPPYDITMVKDVTWKLDIRDDYDRESLRMELVSQLSEVTRGQDNWPGDKLDGQRLVAYRVLSALANSVVGGIESDTPPVTSETGQFKQQSQNQQQKSQ